VVGKERLGRLDVIMAGDDVPRKKPDPIIYSEYPHHASKRQRR
jgi:hypothetical protein